MSFLTTNPEALSYAAGKLQTLGAAMAAESAAAAGPTTGVAPAAADEVSALQAAIFSAYGDLYQSVNAQAATIHQQVVNTLGTSAGSYATTEAANSAAALPFAGAPTAASALSAPSLNSGFANIVNIGAGNWSSAASDLLTMANGGLLPPEAGGLGTTTGAAAGLASAPTGALAGATGPAGFGATPIAAGLGQATSVGRLSVPPSWAAGPGVPAATPSGPTLAGWTEPAPQGPSVTTVPAGMPAVAAAGKAGGLGAPRYGVKPTVMGRPTGV